MPVHEKGKTEGRAEFFIAIQKNVITFDTEEDAIKYAEKNQISSNTYELRDDFWSKGAKKDESTIKFLSKKNEPVILTLPRNLNLSQFKSLVKQMLGTPSSMDYEVGDSWLPIEDEGDLDGLSFIQITHFICR